MRLSRGDTVSASEVLGGVFVWNCCSSCIACVTLRICGLLAGKGKRGVRLLVTGSKMWLIWERILSPTVSAFLAIGACRCLALPVSLLAKACANDPGKFWGVVAVIIGSVGGLMSMRVGVSSVSVLCR